MAEDAGRTLTWCRATGGALSRVQWLAMFAATVREYPMLARDLVRLTSGRGRPDGAIGDWLPTAPDSSLTRAALDACADQGPELEGHGLRTWLFGSMLGTASGHVVDPEELHVAAIAHDVGLARAVTDEDFTVRSAAAAARAWEAGGRSGADAVARMQDGIVAHTTPGLDAATDPLGWVLQAGATADLIGLRLADLPAPVVAEVYRRHPQTGMRRLLVRALRAEAAAVPRGRFALLRRTGFAQAVIAAPHRHR